MLSPLFKVAEYEVQEYNNLSVGITYKFDSEKDWTKAPAKELFPVGSSFPSTKSITFDAKKGGKGGLSLILHYGNGAPLLPGLPPQIALYEIKEAVPKHEKFSAVIRISNNIHQIPSMESAELHEEWVEEEKIPVKKDAPAKKETKPSPSQKKEETAENDKPAAQEG